MSGENDKQKSSPCINHVSWGRMEVEGLGAGARLQVVPWRRARVGLEGSRERIMFQGFSRLISRSYSITEAEWSSSRAGCSWRFRLAPKRSSCCAN